MQHVARCKDIAIQRYTDTDTARATQPEIHLA